MSPYGTRSKTKPETGSGRLKSRNYEDYVVYSDLENREDEESEWSGSSSEISDQPRKSKKAVGRSRPTIRRKANDTKDSSAARNTWTAKEDGILAKLVQKHGPKKWGLTAGFLPRRNAKQCHQRLVTERIYQLSIVRFREGNHLRHNPSHALEFSL